MESRTGNQRFAPLQLDAMAGEQKVVAEKVLRFSLNGFNGPFNMMLRSPQATDNILGLSDYLRFHTAIPTQLIEFAVLVHARLWSDQYEWDMHVGRARAAEISDETIEDLRLGRNPLKLGPDERAIFDFCVELIKLHTVRDQTFSTVIELLGEKGITDLTVMLGQYAMISMILSVSKAGAGRSPMPKLDDPFPCGNTDAA